MRQRHLGQTHRRKIMLQRNRHGTSSAHVQMVKPPRDSSNNVIYNLVPGMF